MVSAEFAPDEQYMEIAFAQAESCLREGDHPVGAVVVGPFKYWDVENQQTVWLDRVYGAGRNEVHNLGDPTAHAEIKAIQSATRFIGRHGLAKSVLYSTHEPCPMCAGAIANTKIRGVIYATSVEDIETLIQERTDIKWRSNRVRMATILAGRQEIGASQPFIIAGFMRAQGLGLLERTAELALHKPRSIRLEEFLIESGIDPEEAKAFADDQAQLDKWRTGMFSQ